MLTGLALTLFCGVCLASLGAMLGRVTERRTDVYSYYFWGNLFAFLWSCTQVDWSIAVSTHSGLHVLAFWMFLGAMFNNLGHLLLYHNMSRYHRAASWAAAMSSLSVPFVAALLFWREPVTASGLIGLMLILCGIAFLAAARQNGNGKVSLKWAVLALTNLFCYGLAQTAMSAPSHYAELNQIADLRTPLSALFCSTQQLTLVLLIRKRMPDPTAMKAGFVYSLIYFVMLLGIYATLDILTEHKMSKSFWPLASGTCIVLFSIYSHLAQKEHFSRLDCAGLTIIIFALFLLGDFLL